uniref:Uncharacterized protein n=1 Tax=Anguilla anguilla TaxID=7936 RepID=A0A0E9SM31_ANGAN
MLFLTFYGTRYQALFIFITKKSKPCLKKLSWFCNLRGPSGTSVKTPGLQCDLKVCQNDNKICTTENRLPSY